MQNYQDAERPLKDFFGYPVEQLKNIWPFLLFHAIYVINLNQNNPCYFMQSADYAD